MAGQQARTGRRAGGDHDRALFEHALVGIFRSTPAGRFTAVNPALVRMLGYASAAEVLALTLPQDLYVVARHVGENFLTNELRAGRLGRSRPRAREKQESQRGRRRKISESNHVG